VHFSTEAVPAEIPVLMRRLFLITGWRPWKRRLTWLEEQVRVHPTISFYLSERFGLELALEQLRQHKIQSGRYLWPPETAEQQRFYSFLAMVARCHHRLSPAGKTRLKGMLEDALKSDQGLASLAFEMKIAAHFMTRGFDVIFHDMDEGGRFDYLIENKGVEMEVECKFVSGDIGRQIHLKRFHQLGTILLPETANFLDQGCGGRLIRILIPGRLGGDNKQHQEIRRLMLRAISDKDWNANLNGYEVSISEFSIADSPFARLPPEEISTDRIQRFLSDKFEIDNKNLLINFSPIKGAVLVVVESAKKDAVLKGIHHQLKNAARNQFSGDRPSVICCELADLTENQLRGLWNERTGLQFMVNKLMERRLQIHTVAFTTPGTVRIKNTRSETSFYTSIQETGPAYTFTNPSHPLADDPRYDVF